MKKISVCLSPELIHLFDLTDKTVVVVDILRATSCMVAGFANGVNRIQPVASLEECRALKVDGYITAAERGGQKVEGFDLGNSPFDYMASSVRDNKIAVTTTNGTLAITRSVGASNVLIGAFLNISAVANKLQELAQDVVIHCAGWKGSVNAEDSLFAGALINHLGERFIPETDDAKIAHSLFRQHKNDMLSFVKGASHAQRLEKFGILKDIKFCLQMDKYTVVPFLEGTELRL